MSLDRFHEAQAKRSAGYDNALGEIRRGRKTSHWISYIFRQLAGLARSAMATNYAIRGLTKACDYLRDPILRARYEEITAAVSDQLARGLAVEDLMGSRIDALKLVSSLTLLRAAADRISTSDDTFKSVNACCDSLPARVGAASYPACTSTFRATTGASDL
ncbi:MAG: DUF1810 family protein [Chthoniobacterales bacterium]